MQLWQEMEREGMEDIMFCYDARSGLKAIIAIHSTVLGPALGGCRFWSYTSEEEAIRDAIRLAKGMTYKSAVSGLDYGGGKAVIWNTGGIATSQQGDPARNALFQALGRCLERMNGRYVTGLDLGTTAADMDQIRLETAHVTDTTGSLGAQNDFTADMTAFGVYTGIVTSLRHQGVASVQGIPIAVQGLGKVGHALCRYLHAAGARLIVADVVPDRVQQALSQFSGATSADPAGIHAADCKVFAPCALGGVLTPATAEELRCSIVAGAANNQLAEREPVVRRLQARGILYAPDYVLSAGGIISTACELDGAGPSQIRQQVAGIADTLARVYEIAAGSAISTLEAADQLAEARLTGRSS